MNILDLKAAYEEAIGHPTSDSTVYHVLNRHDWRKLMLRPFVPPATSRRCPVVVGGHAARDDARDRPMPEVPRAGR